MKVIITYFAEEVMFALDAVEVNSVEELTRIIHNCSRSECRIFHKGATLKISHIGIDIKEGHEDNPRTATNLISYASRNVDSNAEAHNEQTT